METDLTQLILQLNFEHRIPLSPPVGRGENPSQNENCLRRLQRGQTAAASLQSPGTAKPVTNWYGFWKIASGNRVTSPRGEAVRFTRLSDADLRIANAIAQQSPSDQSDSV
ncbi:hypothetical protein [Methylobacterium sp. SyP6R]|uniref:hypothetical protein n=1 Tax=Methylobacterium sp. SyP6R TaxID=2718876 RepID=UPI001F405DA7|nr:hypothetical protein [Methylobacterium sp. SyP6R]MCF4126866.1 hypothetical protein [Methylobacterium sp. SyP6R]